MNKHNRKSVLSIMKMIAGYEPVYIPASICKILVKSVLTWVMVWFPKLFIELLTEKSAEYRSIAIRVVMYAGILIAIWIAEILISSYETKVTERFVQKMRKEIGSVSMQQPFWVIESGAYREKLNMANNIMNILQAVGILEGIVEGIITSAGLAAMLMKYDIRICLLIFAVISVKIIFVKITVLYSQKRRYLYGKNDRIGNYLTNTAYLNAGAAKEIRINNIADWFMGKIKAYRNEMLSYQYKDFRVFAIFDAVSAVLMAGQTAVVLLSLANRTLTGMISIADFTMYFNAVITITMTLAGVVTRFGDYNQYKVCFGDFSSLYTSLNGAEDVNETNITFGEISFENVSFQYPETEKPVLNNINICIPKGEKLSIVGPNGAGKSTFVKLLCKFYRPTEGRILIDGKDIWEIDNSEYYKMISAVFQDYTNFAFSIRENILMGKENKNLEMLAEGIGFGDAFEKLPKGFDTVISRMFDEEGVDLSGGEQQKVAILRALCKNAPLTILDEPTKALDAKTEAEMYDSFFRLMEGRTAIYVSHRLASSVAADKILVLENGRINDYGTHSRLMKRGGLYSEMYRKQSEVYCE